MPVLVWDKMKDREYQTGLDKGVLYLPDGSAVPWNGLTSVIENFDKSSSPVYYDGKKINELVVLGDFSASMKAITYPDEFIELEGLGKLRHGLFLGDQKPQLFGLCYRTQVGNALEGNPTDYKIHVLYNITAMPKNKTYATITEAPNITEFEWELTSIPEEIRGFRPTAHIIIDSNDVDPWLLEELERILYGDNSADASLIPMEDLVSFIQEWYRLKIIDNGDGTWTAKSKRDGFISFSSDILFVIIHANAIYLNEFTFIISDTLDESDVPEIRIHDYENGIWSASTDTDGLIETFDDGSFQILDATIELIDSNTYRISDTVDE